LAPTLHLHILAKIATVFGVSADVLVFAEEDASSTPIFSGEKGAQFPERMEDAVFVLIDSAIANQTLKEVIGASAREETTRSRRVWAPDHLPASAPERQRHLSSRLVDSRVRERFPR
jgi:hypothetical protein